jgi:hypothetical protein
MMVWKSLDLGNPGQTWISPITGQKPHWSAVLDQEITDQADVEVVDYIEVDRFHVKTRVSRSGFRAVLDDASNKRLTKALLHAGSMASFAFDYTTQEAVVYIPTKLCLLSEFSEFEA